MPLLKCILFDFSRTLIFPNDRDYAGKLNVLYTTLPEHRRDDNFFHWYTLNDQLIAKAYELKHQGYKIALYTSGALHEIPCVTEKIQGLFDHVFTTRVVGLAKDDPAVYYDIALSLDLSPAEVLFIDDLEKNCTGAREAGMQAIQFKNNEQCFREMDTFGIHS